jgi:cell wall-associated NlpC family hydrolase
MVSKKRKDDKAYRIITPTAVLAGDSSGSSKISDNNSQMLFGEIFDAEWREDEWVYGTSSLDGYKGYVHSENLKAASKKITHVTTRLFTAVYPRSDFKAHPLLTIPFMSRVHVEPGPTKDGFVKTPDGWIFKDHLKKISELNTNRDPVIPALKFLGCPYLYGGRSPLGVDCSGLVQIALSYCAIPCPRDTKDQVEIGTRVLPDNLTRGDLVFFKGHVGIMVDREHILNATARTMDVRIEKLNDLAVIYKGVTAIRRPR